MTYEEACRCAGKDPNGFTVDESEEESLARRFGNNYSRVGVGLITRSVWLGDNLQESQEFVARKSQINAQVASKGYDGLTGKPGVSVKSISGKSGSDASCMCGSWGKRGNNGSKGR
jgi:hypothetical protein